MGRKLSILRIIMSDTGFITPPSSPTSGSSEAEFRLFRQSSSSNAGLPSPPKRSKTSKFYDPDQVWIDHWKSIIRIISQKMRISAPKNKSVLIREFNKLKGVMTQCIKLVFLDEEDQVVYKLFVKIGKWYSKYRSLQTEGKIAKILNSNTDKSFLTPFCHNFFELRLPRCANVGIIVYEYMDEIESCINPKNNDRENILKSFQELEELDIIRCDIVKNVKVTPGGQIIHFDFENDHVLQESSYTSIYKKESMDEFISYLMHYFVNNIMIPTPDL